MPDRITGARAADIREIAAAQVERLSETAAGLGDCDLVAPTLCAGWLAAHLLMHVRAGLEAHATCCAEPAGPGEDADRDYVSYWTDWPASNAPVTYGGVRFQWATASAYANADSLRRHFADATRAAAGNSLRAPEGLYRFQGHVMDSGDLLAMWTVEWVVHHLDLTAHLAGDRPAPLPEAVTLATATLDGLLGPGARPSGWDDVTYVLKGTGRIPLTEQERHVLADHAGRYPAFG